MKSAACAVAFALGCAVRAGAAPEVGVCGEEQASWRLGNLPAPREPDLRFLGDAPAGRHGFVVARGEGLEFEDGTPARFWGANVVAAAIFETPDEAIDAHALRLAKLGFNLVRLHHHDSGGWQTRTAVSRDATQPLDPIAMRKIDRWVARLKEHGIYVWLDLQTGRVFRESEDIPAYDELARGSPQGAKAKGFLYVNPRLQELVLEFAAAFLDHRNPWTGLRYRDDPAIAAVLVTNENDITHHFGNVFAANKNNPWHRARFLEAAAAFADRTRLPRAALGRTWEAGASKLLLADLEHAFDSRARAQLRAAGLRAPLALTSYWGRSGIHALAALAEGELIDTHSYATGAALRSDPRAQLGYLGWIAAGQLAGKPLTVSEWNHGAPLQRERYETPLWTAAVARLQDWDALMLYAYGQRPLGRVTARQWNAASDPATVALMPAAAALYRRGDAAPARSRVVLTPSREDFFFRGDLPGRSTAIATLLEQHRVSIAIPAVRELPWLRPTPAPKPGVKRVRDLARSFLAADATRIRSDTGEIERDIARGILRIDTPRTRAAVGALALGAVSLSGVRIAAQADGAVVFTSLDGKPLEVSQRILVSVAARACATPKARGWRAEPMRGSAWLATKGERRLVPVDGAAEPSSLARKHGEVAVPLDFGGSWALIEPAR